MDERMRIPLDIVEAPFRDLSGPMLEEVRRFTSKPGTAGDRGDARARSSRSGGTFLLHNQNALFVKRLFLFEPNVILSSVPYLLGITSEPATGRRSDGPRGRRRALPREVPEGDHGPAPDLGGGGDARARAALRARRGPVGPDGPVPRPRPGPHGRRRCQPRPARRRVAPRGRRRRTRDQRRARARVRGVPHRPHVQGRGARRRGGRAAGGGRPGPAGAERGHEGLVREEEAEGEGVRAGGQPGRGQWTSRQSIGLPLDEFLSVSIEGLQLVAPEIGL